MSLSEKLKNHIESKPEMKSPTSDLRVSAAGACLRKLDYDGLYGAPPLNDLSFMRFEVGHGVDKIFKALLSEIYGSDFIGFDDELEILTPKGNKIIGHPDGELVSQDAIVEIKSCAGSTFDQVERSGSPMQEHFEQGNLYAHARNRTKIIFIYFNKNSSRYLVIEKSFDLGQAVYNLEKFDLAAENRANKNISPRLYVDEEASPCYYCGHRERCYADFVKDTNALNKNVTIKDDTLAQTAGLFHDTRKFRLNAEKLEENYKSMLDKQMAIDNKAQDVLVMGKDRKFKVQIKPTGKLNRLTTKVTEVTDEQHSDEE